MYFAELHGSVSSYFPLHLGNVYPLHHQTPTLPIFSLSFLIKTHIYRYIDICMLHHLKYPHVLFKVQFIFSSGFKKINWIISFCMYKSREGNGNPLQYSCLENPMGGGAWWAAVHGVAKSRLIPSSFTPSNSSRVSLIIDTRIFSFILPFRSFFSFHFYISSSVHSK